jgi:hypothetical protein
LLLYLSCGNAVIAQTRSVNAERISFFIWLF